MATSATEDHRGATREMFVQQAVGGKTVVSASAHNENSITNIERRPGYPRESPAEKRISHPMEVTFHWAARGDATKLIGVLQQLEFLAKRHPPRIAFKAKGRIFFITLADIIAVEAEGNYVSLQHRSRPYLLRESLLSIAEKLKPYSFIRIHRSVLVNTTLVEEIQPLSTGEYKLRVKGGKEYMVTRTYRDNLRFLAHLWLGSEHFCR